jgi:hypothetical protein
MNNLEQKPAVMILHNNSDIQAVTTTDASSGGAVFYKAGKADLMGGTEADSPCVVMLKKEKGILMISLSDPTQKLEQIRLTLNGKYEIKGVNARIQILNKQSILDISLPSGGEAGKTVNLSLKTLK